MNSRNVHRLMRRNFSHAQPAQWVYFCDCSGRNEQPTVEAFLRTHFRVDKVLVEVHRSIGGYLSLTEASALIAAHLCKANVRVADRAFTTFAVFAGNGVVASWSNVVEQAVRADGSSFGGDAA